jgi:hypothetical protein
MSVAETLGQSIRNGGGFSLVEDRTAVRVTLAMLEAGRIDRDDLVVMHDAIERLLRHASKHATARPQADTAAMAAEEDSGVVTRGMALRAIQLLELDMAQAHHRLCDAVSLLRKMAGLPPSESTLFR